jgi:hypothetical protein
MAKCSVFNRPRPPRVVHICGQKLKVKIVPYLESDGCELVGAFNAETKTIFLTKGCDWKPVLLHELTHAIFCFTGAGEGLTMTREEQLCLAIEHALAPLLFS